MPKIRISISILLTLLFYLFQVLALINFFRLNIRAIFLPYQLDSVEGQIIEQAMMVSRGENIYRPDISTPPYTVSNYTPLYMLVLSPFMAIWGPNFWAGRLISTASTLLSAFFLGLIIWSISCNLRASLASAGLFLAFPTVVYWTMLVRIDMLGLLFCLVGLWLYIRSNPNVKLLFWVSVLLILAVYTRQTYGLAAPGAVLCSLALKKQWKLCGVFIAFYAGIGLGLLLIFNILSEGGFIFQIFAPNLNLWHSIEYMWGYYVIFAGLIAGMVYLLWTREWLWDWIILIFFLIGGTMSASAIGKMGSNVNYFNEFAAGMCLILGMMTSLAGSDSRKQMMAYTIIIIMTGLFLFTTNKIAVPLLADRSSPEATANFNKLRSMVHNSTGSVITDEFNGILALEGRKIYIHTVDMAHLSQMGLWDQQPFLDEISQQKFPYIFVTQTSEEILQDRWTPEMMASIKASYHILEKLGFTTVYVPNSQP